MSGAALTAGLIYAAAALSQSDPPVSNLPATPPVAQLERETAQAVVPELAGSFGVLRRAATARDRLPTGLATMVTSAPSDLTKSGQTKLGANVALSRRVAGTPEGGAVYVVPGNGSLCIATIRPEGRGLSCATELDEVLREGINQTQAAIRGVDGRRISGVVPDGIVGVRIVRAADLPVEVAVTENGFSADVSGEPTSLEYIGASGAVVDSVSL